LYKINFIVKKIPFFISYPRCEKFAGIKSIPMMISDPENYEELLPSYIKKLSSRMMILTYDVFDQDGNVLFSAGETINLDIV
jgi:hypothetical protein